MAQQNTNMRDYKITKNEGEWYYAVVTDSYGTNTIITLNTLMKLMTGYIISGKMKSGLIM